MGIIRRGVLQVVDRLYDLAGGPVPTIVDVDSPVVMVHDVSREAELNVYPGSPETGGGYMQDSSLFSNVSGGASTIFVQVDIYDSFDASLTNGFRTRDHRLWLVFASGAVNTTNAANWSNATSSLVMDGGRHIPIGHWIADFPSTISGAERPMGWDTRTSVRPAYGVAPIFIPLGTIWAGQSTSTNDSISTLRMRYWAGPIGTTPPGMQ